MNSLIRMSALLALGCIPLSSCGYVTPEGATRNRKSVVRISRDAARSDGFETRHFKNHNPVFLAANRVWYTSFEERGMLLAAGEQFTVFLDDATGRTRLHRDTGIRDRSSREHLAKLRGDPSAAVLPTLKTTSDVPSKPR